MGMTLEKLNEHIDARIKTGLKPILDEALAPLLKPRGEFTVPDTAGKTPEEQARERLAAATAKDPNKGIRFGRAVRAIAASARGYAQNPAWAAENLYKDPTLARALAESAATAGGTLVPEQYSGEVIELLRETSVFRGLGPRIVNLDTNVLKIPRITGGSTAQFIEENAYIPKSELTTGMVNMTPRKLAGLTAISNDLLRDASVAVDALVRDDLATAIALRADIAAIRDDGTSSKPKGLRYSIKQDAYPTGNVVAVTAGASPDYATLTADLKKIIKAVRKGRKGSLVRPAWIMTTRTYIFLYFYVVASAATPQPFMAEMAAGRFLGFPYAIADQIPENLGTGTDETELYFNDFVDTLWGESLNLEIEVSTQAAYDQSGTLISAFSADQTVVKAISKFDVGMRHDTSGAVGTGVQWT